MMQTETKAQMRHHIANCPWKDKRYGYCWTCKVRADYLPTRKRWRTHHPGTHEFMSNLRPAPECDTGR